MGSLRGMDAFEAQRLEQAGATPRGGSLARGLAVTQGGYYAVTGLWPILHLRSFERLTGRKKEGWLVKTFGGLVMAVGGALLLSARRRQVTPEVRVLGLGTALALAVADVWYPLRGRISKVYLLDAAAEAALVGGWAFVHGRRWQKKHAVRAEAYAGELIGGRAGAMPAVAPI